jgi:hypothetical protein
MKRYSEQLCSARSALKPHSNATCESHLPPPTPSPATADPQAMACYVVDPQAPLPLPPQPMTLSPAAVVANPKPCCCRRRPQASW